MLTNGGVHTCKTYRLVVLLLLCAIPATVQYCRQARRQTPGRTGQPQRVIYELLGEVTRPGIYRYAEEQTRVTLAAACGTKHTTAYDADATIAGGTRLLFNEEGSASTSIDAHVLLSYHLPISLAVASAEDLELIPGIGPKTARALVDYNERAGPIDHIGQLVEVRGIGPKTLKKIARYLSP